MDQTPVHYNNRGLAFYHFDKLTEAKEDFDKAIELDQYSDKPDPTIYFNRGNVSLNWKPKQDFDAAHADYDKALSISPHNAKLWHSKGLAFQGQAEYIFRTSDIHETGLIERAIDMYLKALNIQEHFVSSRFHLGLMYHRLNKFQDALKCFSKVLARINDDKTVYIARGVVYQDMGNH